jgi:hypothetical protein
MKTRLLWTILLASTLVQAADAAGKLAPLPSGWNKMTANGGPLALPSTCDIGVDSELAEPGRQVYAVRCDNKNLPSFGGGNTYVQTSSYRGKRIRVSAWLKAADIEGVSTPQYAGIAGEAGLWIGVGSPRNGMRMDRMQNRAISGTTDWEYRDFVVDVPQDNRQIMVGYWMQGKGQLWVRDYKIEEVPATVPVNFLVEDPDRVVGPDLSLQTLMAPRPRDYFLPPPAKWLVLGGPRKELCDAGVDAQMLQGGQRNLSISCGIAERLKLRQSFEAAPFWGKRVRFSAWVKVADFESIDVIGPQEGAGLFMTTGNATGNGQTLTADGSGTSGWQYRELVMEVPPNTTWVLIGLTLGGKGQVWARDLKFELVSRDVPVTEPATMPATIP